MKKCDQNLSGKVGIHGQNTGLKHHLHLQQIGGSEENGMNHIKKNGKISNGGKSDKYSLSDPPTLQESCAFLFKKHFAYRHWRMWCTRRVVKTAHLVRVTQTHIFLVVCTRDSRARHTINAHALAQEHVECLSPRAHQKSSVRLTFRRTLLDVPNPFPSLCLHHLLHSLHC